jgi:hypothetical protein
MPHRQDGEKLYKKAAMNRYSNMNYTPEWSMSNRSSPLDYNKSQARVGRYVHSE